MKTRLAKICPILPFAIILAINLLASCNKTSLEDQIYDCFYTGDLKKIKKLVKKGADINYNFGSGKTLMYYQVSISSPNDLSITQYFIDNGVNLNTYVLYKTPQNKFLNYTREYLISECTTDKEKAQLLIDNGAPFDIDCGNGITPLMIAIEKQSHCKDYYEVERTPYPLIETLVKNGADVNHRADNGLTPLMLALEFEEKKVASLLIQNGAVIHPEFVDLEVETEPGNPYAENFSDTSVKMSHSELYLLAQNGMCEELEKYLEETGFNPYKKAKDGFDLFCYAVMSNDYDTVKMILKYNKNLDAEIYKVKMIGDEYPSNFDIYDFARYYEFGESQKAIIDSGSNGRW